MSTTFNTDRGEINVRHALPKDGYKLRALRLEALANHPESFMAEYEASASEP